MKRWSLRLLLFVFFFVPSASSASLWFKKQTNHKGTEETKKAEPARKVTTLNGPWRFRRDDQKEWKTVTLPTHWETHEGLKFDGIGWYEKEIELAPLPGSRRILLHFDAVATHATVYWNDVMLGEHLGAWTPFRFDVTEHIRKSPPSPPRREGSGVRGKHTLRIRVDERVGHNTQGFLPIIQPHFGGVWQGVKLIEVPETFIDDLRIGSLEYVEKNQYSLRIPIIGNDDVKGIMVTNETPDSEEDVGILNQGNVSQGSLSRNGEIKLKFAFQPSHWSPQSPKKYKLNIWILNGQSQDVIRIWVAFRTISTRGDQFLLNGQPLSIRGVLNWGYYPPSLSPDPPENVWRRDLKLIKSWGFNLMKCCLWVPPKRLLEIADEEGVLIWLEYPTWHPQLTPKYQAELLREYREFHQLDRNHPSVILRSLTCETGPGADLGVIKKLYDQCKAMCGGLVVDDSSWIEWNRICDFYDDHPYGNNHTWVATLDRLKKYIATSKLGTKPLCLGEAIAADTWVPTKPMLEAIAKAKADPKQAWSLDERGYPYWVPGFFDANQKWLERMGMVCGGKIDERRLELVSLDYAELMRKYQIETYRREVPNGGYVVSVMRDFPLASMGLLDYQSKPKWAKENWNWHGDPVIFLRVHNEKKVALGWPIEGSIEVKASKPVTGELVLKLLCSTGNFYQERKFPIDVGPSENKSVADFIFNHPGEGSVVAELRQGNSLVSKVVRYFHDFRVKGEMTVVHHISSAMKPDRGINSEGINRLNRARPVICGQLDDTLIGFLESGGKLLLLPNGKTGSFPLRAHWFLRGGPFINESHSVGSKIWTKQIELLQHFDLASDVIPDINYLEEIDPILMLWDNHDLKEVKTQGLVFETRVGKGRLLVSALNHQGETNAAGRWLLDVFLKHLDSGPPPRNALKPETIARMRAKLNEKKIDLVTKSWQFMPDGKEEGLTLGWHQLNFDDKSWKPTKIGQPWEGQGFPKLDGWAWYRIALDIPKDWPRAGIYLNSEGVDDAYEIYVNGIKIGEGGDIPNKKTAFEERKAHPIPALVFKPGEQNVIAIRVHDWYGAGGIHRPITLSNTPIGGIDILK